MKRLKARGLTPISVKKAQGLFANSGKSDKRNQVTAIAVTKLREKKEREKNKKKGLKKDVEIPFSISAIISCKAGFSVFSSIVVRALTLLKPALFKR